MDGLYALKPWYAARLGGVRTALVARRTSPAALTAAGVAAGIAGGVALATGHGAYVAPLVLVRLACANLDGGVARDSGRCTPWGAVVNEVGDRAADLALMAGAFAIAPPLLVAAAMLAASAPSWCALAGAAAGAPRRNGGPVGKTERCLLLALAGLLPALLIPALWIILAGSLATAAVRLARLRTALGSAR